LLHEYQKIEAKLKRYEDAIDALICCWVGTLYAEGNARPMGDDTTAIWCPLRQERL
jgi:predicted RNase H-like nuclease